ncbi:E3 ubiquitin-protein ligase RNF180-like [Embiotoca jacksoni]|uniref:E3 ubiquitin-protein ligase RNF180-like n=1 Tax=Embiotoca jacksoni TaxID=100190 RepID=UPI003703AC1B
MLRCRKCRKAIIDSTCLSTVQATEESSAAVCRIWHVNVDTMPEWILISVNQAQWTVGKLNCQNCGARLGGFNFINCSECPCGQDGTVHLSKSRVDHDQDPAVLIVQPRRTRPGRGRAGLLSDGSRSREERTDFDRTAQDSLQLNCAAVTSFMRPAEASNPLGDGENSLLFSFSPLYCISHRRRGSLEDDADLRSSCFCPAGPANTSVVDLMRSGSYESARSTVSYPTSWQFARDGDAVPRRSSVSGGTRPHRNPQLLPSGQDVESSVETTVVDEEVPDAALLLRGTSLSDSEAKEEEEVLVEASVDSSPSNRLSKREKNHLKSLRRKQRRRERWLRRQQEQEQAVSESDLPPDEDRDGLTCAICLDVFFSPYSCQPCGHVFCEPCLRTLANNRMENTTCPLCRAVISSTSFHKELNQTTKIFFPKVYFARQKNFQKASCANWPLPRFYRNHLSALERTLMLDDLSGFNHLPIFNEEDLFGWFFVIVQNIGFIQWILALPCLSMLLYYFLF